MITGLVVKRETSLFLTAWLWWSAAPARAELRAGVAKVDITPQQPCVLAGYAGRTNLSTGVHDLLSARAVALEEGGKRLVLVSSDLIGYYKTVDSMRSAILDACNLKPEELLLTAIHTHAAPTASFEPEKPHPNNVEYTKTVTDKDVQVLQIRETCGEKPPRFPPARLRAWEPHNRTCSSAVYGDSAKPPVCWHRALDHYDYQRSPQPSSCLCRRSQQV